MKALREFYSFFNLVIDDVDGLNLVTARFNSRDLVPFVQEAWPVWTSREYLPPPILNSKPSTPKTPWP